MDYTSQMIQLLGSLRKEMNGAVADSMYYYGADYGLNYGVSLPTIRSRAAQVEKEHQLARYLYKQQVRELKLAALHIAQPEEINLAEADFWAEGIINSEMAEEMAFALLPHSQHLGEIFDKWTFGCNEFLAYSAMMAMARSLVAESGHIIEIVTKVIKGFPDSRIIAQGSVALLAAMQDKGVTTKEQINLCINSMPQGKAKEYVAEEMSWRMEF